MPWVSMGSFGNRCLRCLYEDTQNCYDPICDMIKQAVSRQQLCTYYIQYYILPWYLSVDIHLSPNSTHLTAVSVFTLSHQSSIRPALSSNKTHLACHPSPPCILFRYSSPCHVVSIRPVISADRSWSRSSDSSVSAFFSTKTAGPMGISIKKHLISKQSTVLLCDFLKFQQKNGDDGACLSQRWHVLFHLNARWIRKHPLHIQNWKECLRCHRSCFGTTSSAMFFSKNHPKVFLGSRFFYKLKQLQEPHYSKW